MLDFISFQPPLSSPHSLRSVSCVRSISQLLFAIIHLFNIHGSSPCFCLSLCCICTCWSFPEAFFIPFSYILCVGTTPAAPFDVTNFVKSLESIIGDQPSPIQEGNQYLMAGYGKGKAAGGGIAGPSWLKVDLPVVAAGSGRGPSSFRGEPTWSLSLSFPLPNVLHEAMLEHCAMSGGGGQAMLNYYDPTAAIVRPDHHLILGSSGCGKTALGLSLGEKNFLVLLEMPSEKSGGEDPVRGFQTRSKDWCKNFQTEDEVHAVLYADIVSRLIVLKHVLEYYPNLTPTQWLLYCFSRAGSNTVRQVHSTLWAGATWLSSALLAMIEHLQRELERLNAARYPEGLPLILFVDELQELGNLQATAGKSVIEAVVFAATSLYFPTVWSGTRVGVTAGKSDISGIAKVYKGQVNLRVVCDFEYLSAGSVRHKLLGMLDLSYISEDVQRRMGYLLQGRARMMATFVEVLLNRQRYGGRWPNVLTDEVLMGAIEDLFEHFVVPRYVNELGRMCGDTGYGRGEVGKIWAFNMLPPPANRLEAAAFDRRNSLSFTRSVKEVKIGSEEFCKTEHHFTYQFGEPGLQEALLRYVTRPGVDRSVIAMAGIQAYILSQDSASGLGACCDRALALSFLVRRKHILRTMLSGHPGLHIYQDYEFTVKRVVEVNAEQQLEWFQLVNSDPISTSFSLMPGIPVRDILILPSTFSGADVIGVATPPEAGLTAEAGKQGGGEERAFSYATRSGAKKARVQVCAPGRARVPLLFVQICSALYWSKVPTAKVEDQMGKCAEQFATQGGGGAAKEYAKIERELLGSGQISHLSILSELPTSSYIYSEEDKNKFVRMRSEEIVAWGLFSMDLMNQIRQMKGHQEPAGEKGEAEADA